MSAAPGVLVVADATSSRRRLRAAVHTTDGLRFAGEADDILSALEQVKSCRPDVVLLDLPLRQAELARAERLIDDLRPGVRIVVLPDTVHAQNELLDELVDVATEPAAAAALRAVVCDDDAMTRRLVGQVLAVAGVDVVADIDVVPNLVPVVEVAKPDLVILDL